MLRRVQVETDTDVRAEPECIRQWCIIAQAANSASERSEVNPTVEFRT